MLTVMMRRTMFLFVATAGKLHLESGVSGQQSEHGCAAHGLSESLCSEHGCAGPIQIAVCPGSSMRMFSYVTSSIVPASSRNFVEMPLTGLCTTQSRKVMLRTTKLPMEPMVRPTPLASMRSNTMSCELSFTAMVSSRVGNKSWEVGGGVRRPLHGTRARGVASARREGGHQEHGVRIILIIRKMVLFDYQRRTARGGAGRGVAQRRSCNDAIFTLIPHGAVVYPHVPASRPRGSPPRCRP
jgi:hypothetical protein